MNRFKFFLALLGVWLAVPALAQPSQSLVYCSAHLESSFMAKDLYGGKLGFFIATIECKNYSATPSPQISGVDFDLSMSNTDTVDTGDASAIITKTFNAQKGQQWSRGVNTATGSIGAGLALNAVKITARGAGLIMGISSIVEEFIIPLFTANEPPLDLSNQCGSLQPMLIPAMGDLKCKAYIVQPPKGQPLLPSVIPFTILTAPPAIPAPPPIAPVKLRGGPSGALREYAPPAAAPLPSLAEPPAAPAALPVDRELINIPAQEVTFSRPDIYAGPGMYLQLAALSEDRARVLARRVESYGFEVASERIDGGIRVLVGPIAGGASAARAVRANLDAFGFPGTAAVQLIIATEQARR